MLNRSSRIIVAKHFQHQANQVRVTGVHYPSPLSNTATTTTMSYYFAIIGTQDNPLFEYEFGTSKQGGDGVARFPEQARHMNQFIVHSSLDIVEEVQWGSGQLYVAVPFESDGFKAHCSLGT